MVSQGRNYISPLEDLNAILNEFEIGLHAAGLKLILSKTRLFPVSDNLSFPNLSNLIPVSQEGVEILGTSVGSTNCMAAELPKKFSAATDFCHRVTPCLILILFAFLHRHLLGFAFDDGRVSGIVE